MSVFDEAYALGKRACFLKCAGVETESNGTSATSRVLGGLLGGLGGGALGAGAYQAVKMPSSISGVPTSIRRRFERHIHRDNIRKPNRESQMATGAGAVGGGALGALAPRVGGALGGTVFGGLLGSHAGGELGRMISEKMLWNDIKGEQIGALAGTGLGALTGGLGGYHGLKALE